MFPLAKESFEDNLTKDDIKFICRLAKKINEISEARQISINSNTVKVFKAKDKQKWAMAKRKFTEVTSRYTQ